MATLLNLAEGVSVPTHFAISPGCYIMNGRASVVRMSELFKRLEIILFIFSLALSSCLNGTVTWQTNSNNGIYVTGPATSTLINQDNQSAFTVTGGCSSSGQMIYVFVNGLPSSTTATCQSGGSWTATLNLSGMITYDSTVVISASTSSSSQSLTGALSYAAQWCSSSEALINSPFAGGSGTAQSPYIVCTTNQYTNIISNLSSSFKLLKDLNFNSTAAPLIGIAVGSPFTGTFDGGSHTISNALVTGVTSPQVLGLFNFIEGATIKNLTLSGLTASETSPSVSGTIMGILAGEDLPGSSGSSISNITITNPTVTFSSTSYTAAGVGALLGISAGNGTQIQNVTVTGLSTSVGTLAGSSDVWGLIGQVSNATGTTSISSCSTSGTINASIANQVGGLIGSAIAGTSSTIQISGSSSTANVYGSSYVGGLIGIANTNTGTLNVQNSYWLGGIVQSSNNNGTGGLIGEGSGNISGCYANGTVTSTNSSTIIGGLIGVQYTGDALSVTDSYAKGTVGPTSLGSGSVGGIVGQVYTPAASFLRVYADVTVQNSNSPGCLASAGSSSPSTFNSTYWNNSTCTGNDFYSVTFLTLSSGSGENSTNMTNQSTFSGWNFSGTWKMPSSGGDPVCSTNSVVVATHIPHVRAQPP